MPESETSKRRTSPVESPVRSRPTRTSTPPTSVNLTALPTRLTSTCRSRPGSPLTTAGTPGAVSALSSSPLSRAGWARSPTTSSSTVRTSKSVSSRRILPASIFEKSRMSLTISRRASPEVRTDSAYSRWTGSSSVSSSTRVSPMTPFIGVRISWLMLARKSDLSCDASRAWPAVAPRSPSRSSGC